MPHSDCPRRAFLRTVRKPSRASALPSPMFPRQAASPLSTRDGGFTARFDLWRAVQFLTVCLSVFALPACRSAGSGAGAGAGSAGASKGVTRVDLTAKSWFPPIVTQQGNSCAQQAGLYYLLTAERNRERGVSSWTSPAARLSPYQSYAILADNMTAGTHVEDGWQLAREMGVPLESDAPRGGSSLMNGFDKYVRAASRKPAAWRFLPLRTAADLKPVKDLLAAGHPLACDFQIRGAKLVKLPGNNSSYNANATSARNGSGLGGGSLVRDWTGTGQGHVMVYAGYDDTIGWDFNGDGKITNDVDITGDGRITLADWERGAFLAVNPWGRGWGTGGKAWIPWRAHALNSWPRSGEVATVTAAPDKTPKLMLRLLLHVRDRSSLIITAGSGGKNDTAPQRTVQPLPFRAAAVPFTHPGKVGSWEVFGRTHRPGPQISPGPLAAPGGSPLEIGLDVSTLGTGAGRYFLELHSADGKTLDGTLIKASFVQPDSTGGVRKEIPLTGLPVRLGAAGGRWTSP